MILSVESSLKTFKPIRFQPGLNVLLADTHPEATGGQTRNSVGKSSLIEIIHFLLGAQASKDSLLRTEALNSHSFTGVFVIGDAEVAVTRSGADAGKIYLDSSKYLPVELKRAKRERRWYVSLEEWKRFLGTSLFELPSDSKASDLRGEFSPSFRSLISYFARRDGSGGFHHQERHSEKQSRWNYQACLSYLVGLDWRISSEFEKVRVRERSLREVKKAAQSGAFGSVVGTVAELRPQIAVAESRAQRLREQLSNFQVLDSYKAQANRAAAAKDEMQSLAANRISLLEQGNHLELALRDERVPSRSDLEQLYSAAGVELPGVALRRFEEVSRFYDSVISNRRTHLEQQIRDLQQAIAQIDEKLGALDAERSGLLRSLRGKGALTDFLEMQGNLASLNASIASMRERYKAAVVLEGGTVELEIDRANLLRRLQEDHAERQEVLNGAMIAVHETIGELYDDRAGRLELEATANGPEFKVSIEGDRGGGIANVEIFCMDVTLAQLATRIGGPGFLIHDSHLFDGVDERQIARALALGSRIATKLNQQYIVTMNSDVFDNLPLPEEINREQVVLPVRLSDQTETGGLFGFRF